MNSNNQTREKLREQLRDDFWRQYDECKETWRLLETKAQVSMTVAGVFLAATFGFVRDIDKLGAAQALLLSVAVLLLVVTVCCGLTVFWTTVVEAPPLGTFTKDGVFDLLKKPDAELPGYLDQFLQDQATTWLAAIVSIGAANDRKAIWVWRAQLSLVIAITVSATFTLLRIVP